MKADVVVYSKDLLQHLHFTLRFYVMEHIDKKEELSVCIGSYLIIIIIHKFVRASVQ